MSDFEAKVSELLHRRASSMVVHPDLEAVVDAERWVKVSGSRDIPHRRRPVLAVAAAVLVLVSIGALVVVRRSSDPESAPAEPLPGNGVIVVNGADGLQAIEPSGERRRVPLPVADVVAWAPDGRRLAFSSAAGNVSVFDVRSETSTRVGTCGSTLGSSCSIAWSPDGGRVAVTGSNEIRFFDVESPSDEPVATIAVAGRPDALNWTRDQRLVYRLDADRGISIESTSIDGSDRRTIAEPNRTAVLLQYESVAVSPDGSTVVWIDGRRDPSNSTMTMLQLMTMDLAVSTATYVRDLGGCLCVGGAPAVTWSPDGTRLALVVVGEGPPEAPRQTLGSISLYTSDPAGGDIHYLAPGFGKPAWQPLPNS